MVGLELHSFFELRQSGPRVPSELGDLPEKVVGGSTMLAFLQRRLEISIRLGLRLLLVGEREEFCVSTPGVEFRHLLTAADRLIQRRQRLGKTFRPDEVSSTLEFLLRQ